MNLRTENIPGQMLKIRRWVRSYFGFTRNQTNGFLILMPLILMILFVEPAYEWWANRSEEVHLFEMEIIDSTIAAWEKEDQAEARAPVQPFEFDPNSASVETLTKLGFQNYIAQRIINYRSHGGQFRVKSDLYKIYGIDSARLTSLLPYITLPDSIERRPKVKTQTFTALEAFDLNMADSLQLLRIRGVGPVLSSRIINYRISLGGFVDSTQLFEVWGLDSAVAEEIMKHSFILQPFSPQKININTASESELSRHPYLNWKMARLITTYRFQHGSFTDISDLTRIDQLDSAQLREALPYLTIK